MDGHMRIEQADAPTLVPTASSTMGSSKVYGSFAIVCANSDPVEPPLISASGVRLRCCPASRWLDRVCEDEDPELGGSRCGHGATGEM